MSLLLRIFLPFSLGYYLSFLFRTVNVVIYRDLVSDLGLQAAGLGLLTSAFFLPFALVQLPLGLMLDRFGPRLVDASLLLLAGCGALAFSFGSSLSELVMARALIGVGVSGCLMSSMKAFTLWYPIERYAAMNGWLLAVGGLGAVSATAPVEAALQLTDWRGVFQVLSALTFLVSGLIFAIVPERGIGGPGEGLTALFGGLKRVLADRVFQRIGWLSITQLGAAGALQSLWIGPWLRDVVGFEPAATAASLTAVMIAMTAGFLFFGGALGRLERRGWSIIGLIKIGSLLGLVSLAGLVVLSFHSGPGWIAVALWMSLSFFTTVGTLGFPLLARQFPTSYAGRATTSLNMFAFIGAFITQFGVGPVLDLWPSVAGRYAPDAYGVALLAIALAQALALANLYLSARIRRNRSGE